MSLVRMILPILEQQLLKIEPEEAQLALTEAKLIGQELITWAESKLSKENKNDVQV